MKKCGFLLLITMLFSVLLLSGCSTGSQSSQQAQEPRVLNVGIIPAEDAEKEREAYKPLADYLEKQTGMKVKLFVATDYSGVIEAMRSGKIDIAYFGPFSYILAADKANAEAFVVEKTKEGGTSYHSIIVTNPNLGINSLEDIKGHSFAFVDPASTSGNLIPRSAFKQHGIDPDKDFSSVIYAGGHDACELAVKNRKVDAAADDDVTYNKMKAAGVITDKDVKVIFTSDPIPGSPWAWRKDLSEDLKAKIKTAFLDMAQKDPEGIAKIGGIEEYDDTNDANYDGIRKVAEILHLNKK